MITVFETFKQDDIEWLTKYKLNSDNIRYYYLKQAKFSNNSNETLIPQKLTDTWDGYDDLLFVKNRGKTIDYFEGFVKSCWDALYKKAAYKGLTKHAAVKKLVEERMKKIGLDLNLIIKSYSFEKSILYIKYEIL